MREKIHKDEMAYQKRVGMPYEWLDVLINLDVFSPKTFLSEKVICNHLLDCWWTHRFDPYTRPIYLPFTEIHLLSGKVVEDEEVSFDGGAFARLYRSVVPTAADKRVCFFLLRNQSHLINDVEGGLDGCNHFFSVLFDYNSHRAHVFGTLSVKEKVTEVNTGESSGWNAWSGPTLWGRIGKELGWAADVGDVHTVNVVVKNWPQVCGRPRCAVVCGLIHELPILDRTATIVGYILC